MVTFSTIHKENGFDLKVVMELSDLTPHQMHVVISYLKKVHRILNRGND